MTKKTTLYKYVAVIGPLLALIVGFGTFFMNTQAQGTSFVIACNTADCVDDKQEFEGTVTMTCGRYDGPVNAKIDMNGKSYDHVLQCGRFCRDPLALNYRSENEFPGISDFTRCRYDPGADIPGCTDTTAANYNPLATSENGTCVYGTRGCTDPAATNFSPSAQVDDGSCQYVCPSGTDPSECGDPRLFGCTDPAAQNYNFQAQVDDGTCTYGPIQVSGCTNTEASNYNPLAELDDGSCQYVCPADLDPTACVGTVGCTNPLAVNYNPLATVSDDSCDFCPAGYYYDGTQCVRQVVGTNIMRPQIQCSLDQDWSDDDNSCDQVFRIQNPRTPVYMRAISTKPSCRLRNTVGTWSLFADEVVPNIDPVATLAGGASIDQNMSLTPPIKQKTFTRPVRFQGASPSACTVLPTFDSVKFRYLNIQIDET